MKSFTCSLLLSAASILIAPFASAATFTTVGDSVAVSYNGIVDGDVIGGLSGSTQYTLDSISGDGRTWVFSGSLTNDASVLSRISIAGFDTSAGLDLDGSSVSGDFSNVSGGVMPQGINLDYCLKNTRGNNCAGGGGSGASNGETLDFLFAIQFINGVTEVDLTNFAIRYQSIVGVAQGQGGVGGFTDVSFIPAPEVPLPAAGWLLFSAMGALVAAKRKRANIL